MVAIVSIGGRQFRIAKGDQIRVPKLAVEPGKKVEIDQVLMISEPGKTRVGNPTVEGAKVSATVVEHGREPKVTVFKKKRRKGYRVKRGHRQDYTLLRVESIKATTHTRKKKEEPTPAAEAESGDS